jgi:hypothetical protein
MGVHELSAAADKAAKPAASGLNRNLADAWECRILVGLRNHGIPAEQFAKVEQAFKPAVVETIVQRVKVEAMQMLAEYAAGAAHKLATELPKELPAPENGIPFMLTQQMKADLTARGFTPEQIHNLTPEAAQAGLRE